MSELFLNLSSLVKKNVFIIFFGILSIFLGLGLYTFLYAKGWSYMTNDSSACANCHVMQPYYKGWQSSSHKSVANCNDCHTPPNAVGKYYTKFLNGLTHSYAFTTNKYPDSIQITKRNHEVLKESCISCHKPIFDKASAKHNQEEACSKCHSQVGHL